MPTYFFVNVSTGQVKELERDTCMTLATRSTHAEVWKVYNDVTIQIF